MRKPGSHNVDVLVAIRPALMNPINKSISDSSGEAFIASLVGRLSSAETGTGFIYYALEELVRKWHLVDAAVLLNESSTGPQLFRAGRRAAGDQWSTLIINRGEPGTYIRPSDRVPPECLKALEVLCALSFRLDVTQHLSQHDLLTGLYNRRGFEDLLGESVDRTRRYRWDFGLLVLDFDRFKDLNDTLGHATGDAVLRATGDGLREELRKGDIAARIGGDEIAIILPGADRADLPKLLSRLLQRVNQVSPVEIGFSWGIAFCPSEQDDAQSLFDLADARLYESKGRT